MSEERWTAVDRYLVDLLVPSDPMLEDVRAASVAAGLPAAEVAPNQGKLLYLLARLQGARTILELGTLGGYSTIWLARALPADGRLVTVDVDPRHAEVAQANLARAGVDGLVELRVGDALAVLATLAVENGVPFDLVFLDADKAENPRYLERVLDLTRPGSLIVADNVVRGGAVADAHATDPRVVGCRRFLELVAADPRLEATAIQTVGSKGHDGFALAVVTAGSDAVG